MRVSKFERHHDAYVLVVRDPDAANDYTVDGDVHTIDIDLGASFFGTPEDEEQAVGFTENLPCWLDPVPINSPVYKQVIGTVREAVARYPAALAVIARYQAARER
jgi:hypothetical protein